MYPPSAPTVAPNHVYGMRATTIITHQVVGILITSSTPNTNFIMYISKINMSDEEIVHSFNMFLEHINRENVITSNKLI